MQKTFFCFQNKKNKKLYKGINNNTAKKLHYNYLQRKVENISKKGKFLIEVV